MLDIFVREALASWTLREPDTLAKGAVISFAIFCIERFDWVAAFYADGHLNIGK